MTYRLELRDVVKSFGKFKANDGVNLRIAEGSIHVVLGENGAGKSTLMNIIYGLYHPDSGIVESRGKPVSIPNPRSALDLGIGMVHQHFRQVPTMSVVENVILGLNQQLILDIAGHRRKISELAATLGFRIDPDALIYTLPVGMQQRVEILKLLYRNVDLMILDEPTSVLTPSEVQPFFAMLRKLRESGHTIVLVTHKLEEVMSLADRVTVMRQGKVVADLATGDTSPGELARLMVGREIVLDGRKAAAEPGEIVLDIANLDVLDDRGLAAVRDLSLTVRAGEVLGIAGVDGNGQRELCEAIAGLRDAKGGTISVRGERIDHMSVAERKERMRIGYVPEDRHASGLDISSPITINSILRSFRNRPYSRLGWVDFTVIERHAADLAERYDVRMRGIHQMVRDLSGGNQQKIILAREIDEKPILLVVSQATKGLDVGAVDFVQRTLAAQCATGAAILYVSTELRDLLQIADRVAVIYEGSIVGTLSASEAVPEKLGLMMAGKAQ
ncbi:MAG: ABC transporter ATP-binding protein [Parvibaculaceae bacterium]